MHRLLLCLCLLLMCAAVQASAQDSNHTPSLPAPQQQAPDNRAEVPDSATHNVKFEWAAVSNAYSYGIEIDCYDCGDKHAWGGESGHRTLIDWMVNSPYQFRFYGGHTFSWRVWATDRSGHAGAASEWRVFVLGSSKKKSFPQPPHTNAVVPLPEPYVAQVSHPVDPVTGETCTWPLTLPPDIQPPKATYSPQADYGESSRRAGINGLVRIVLKIGDDGQVKRACLVEAIQPDLGEQALRTLRSWRFEPARKNGTPVASEVVVETDFRMYPWRMQ